MESLAKRMYAAYEASMARDDTGVDKWEDLPEEDRRAWDAAAEKARTALKEEWGL